MENSTMTLFEKAVRIHFMLRRNGLPTTIGDIISWHAFATDK